MSYVEQLREELVAAAAREQARRRPRLSLPPLRPLALVAAGAALLAAIAIAIAGGLRTEPPSEPVPAERPERSGRPLFGGTLVAGERYRTQAFVPELSFVVADENWYVDDPTSANVLYLNRVVRGRPNPIPFLPPSTLAFDRLVEVYDPAVRDRDAARIAAPADPLAWMREHPDLRVGAAEPVTVAGLRGTSADVRVAFDRPAHNDPWCRERNFQCSLLWPTAALIDGARLRVIVLPTEAEPLLITLAAANARRLADLERAAAPVLESLRIAIR